MAHASRWSLCLLLLVVGVWRADAMKKMEDSMDAECDATHPKVGLSAPLSTLQHEVAGTVFVKDDCSFVVQNFTYDGQGPDVFWWAGPKLETLETDYVTMGMLEEGISYDGTKDVEVKLPEGYTWDQIDAISVWCREFAIDFGSTSISESGTRPEDE